jgi:hypothetical protein
MSALDKETLAAACRAIYDIAGDGYVLPPLTRQADEGHGSPSQTYHWRAGHHALAMSVMLDESGADQNISAVGRMPLRIVFDLWDARLGAVALVESDRYTLLRAFFLGAKAPISVDRGNDDCYRISIQLSSTYFAFCGVLPDGNYTPEMICRTVGRHLYRNTAEFFSDQTTGIAIWTARAMQDLLGEPRPSAELFWPREPISRPPVVRSATKEPTLRASAAAPLYALAASVALGCVGLAGITATIWPTCPPAPIQTAAFGAPPAALRLDVPIEIAAALVPDPAADMPALDPIAEPFRAFQALADNATAADRPSLAPAVLSAPDLETPDVPARASLVRMADLSAQAPVVAPAMVPLPVPRTMLLSPATTKLRATATPQSAAQTQMRRKAGPVDRAVRSFTVAVRKIGTRTARGIGLLPRQIASLVTGRSVGR